jgi:hypothetical protein
MPIGTEREASTAMMSISVGARRCSSVMSIADVEEPRMGRMSISGRARLPIIDLVRQQPIATTCTCGSTAFTSTSGSRRSASRLSW